MTTDRRWRWTLATIGAVAALASCAEIEGEGARLGFSLTLPAAEVSEVDSLGMFALDLDPAVFDCARYLAGEEDPIATAPDSVVAAGLEYVESVVDGTQLLFSDVPPGRWVILVECYDAGGSRLFMGCGDVRVESGAQADVEIEMREDPLTVPQSGE